MGSAKDKAKSAKKASKAVAKRLKKTDRAEADSSVAQRGEPSALHHASPTPAERSAAAAERQVRLQRYRVLISLAVALLAIATFAWTVKPWKWLDGTTQPAPDVDSSADVSG